MQTLMQIVLAFLAVALLLIVSVVVLAIQLIRMLAGTEEKVPNRLRARLSRFDTERKWSGTGVDYADYGHSTEHEGLPTDR
jgi:hypothetical protein